MDEYTIGVDVGGTKIAYGLFDGERRLIDRYQEPSDPDLSGEAFLDGIAASCHHLLDRHQVTEDQLRGVGIGLPSYILYDEGKLIKTVSLPNLRNLRARDYLAEKFGPGAKILLDNDANTAALAEYRHGAGRGTRHMLYCAVSTGLGNGIIIDGHLFRGTHGWAGEGGHMLITPGEGVRCGCGNVGCFMSCCSGLLIVKHIQEHIAAGEPTVMTELAGGADNITCHTLVTAFDQGDAMAVWAIDQMAKYLAIWFYNLYVLLDIDCYVLGGGMLNLGDRLFPRVRELFSQYDDTEWPVYFKQAELKNDFGIIGAAELLYQ